MFTRNCMKHTRPIPAISHCRFEEGILTCCRQPHRTPGLKRSFQNCGLILLMPPRVIEFDQDAAVETVKPERDLNVQKNLETENNPRYILSELCITLLDSLLENQFTGGLPISKPPWNWVTGNKKPNPYCMHTTGIWPGF